MTSPDVAAPVAETSTEISHAGVVLQAMDTGRVLMLQRAKLDDDPNAGLWEFPGGSLEPGEDPLAGASREFAEEVGVPIPEEAENGGVSWDFSNYRLHLLTIPAEYDINLAANTVQNPDDPRGLSPEALAFWEPAHIVGDNIRPEVLESMKTIGETLQSAVPPGEAPAVAEEEPLTAAVPPAEEMPAEEAPDEGDNTDLAKIADAISQAKTLHEGHMDGSIPLNAASQQTLMDLINMIHETLVPPAPEETPTEFDALIASAAPVAPPEEWFQPFDLDGPTPLTVTADGRVFGHLATWDSCHRSGQYSNKCTRPPSDPNAPFFQMGQVLTAAGTTVDVGVVTVGGGHASADKRLVAALEHYDDVSTGAATVVVHEDEYGIGLFGSVVPDADPSLVAALRRSPLSGDWRKEKGHWRLVAAHAVVTPGFPIPRGLVASVEGDTFFTTGRVEPKTPITDLRAAAQRLARSAGLDIDSLVASARQAMADIDCECDETLVASVIGDTDMPVASYELGWDGGAATARVFDFYTKGDNIDLEGVARAFLWRNPDQPPDQKSAYDLPFADVINGELQIVPRGVQAAAGGHGVAQLNVSAEDKGRIRSKIGVLYGRIKGKHPEAPDNPFAKETT